MSLVRVPRHSIPPMMFAIALASTFLGLGRKARAEWTRNGVSVASHEVLAGDAIPLRDPTRYIDNVEFRPRRTGPGSSIPCSEESVLVKISGTFPVGCYRVLSAETVPATTEHPSRLGMRLVVGPRSCEPYCGPVVVPWQIEAVLPPIRAGAYSFETRLAESCGPMAPPDSAFFTRRDSLRIRQCLSSDCDFDRNGRADVRDLAALGRCLGPGGADLPACESYRRLPDCDGDDVSNLSDVACCAMRLLEGDCSPCARDSAVMEPRGPRFSLGLPQPNGNSIAILLEATSLENVGGMLIRLRFPSGRYAPAIEFRTGPGWLTSIAEQSDVLSVALVRVIPASRDNAVPESTPVFILSLGLKPGASHGGEVAWNGADLSALDGGSLLPAEPPLSSAILEALDFTLGPSRPNPSSGSTTLRFELPRAGAAELAVYTVQGRRLRVLASGPRTAGRHAAPWDGLDEGGRRAAPGVYYAKLRSAGREAVRRLVRLD